MAIHVASIVSKNILNDYDKKKLRIRGSIMDGGLTDSVKHALEQRIKSPLWGFIILAWTWFNWPNLAMLFMSDAPVKFRIDYILSQDYFYLYYVFAPILSGSILAVVSPYAQWLLSQAHRWADDRYKDNVFQSKERVFQDNIKLSKLKVQSDMAVDVEIAKINADIQTEVERGKREQILTEELETQKKILDEKIELLTKKLEDEKADFEELLKEKQKIQDIAINVTTLLEKALRLDDRRSVQQLVDEISDLFSVEDFELSEQRNALKNGIRKKRSVAEFIEEVKLNQSETSEINLQNK
ncbi:TPA: hypothetical protein MD061_003627 [Klebsiella pneumoniae]|uniref:hypothetical protein n=1 Tax=Enterobacteriaceae TaxID=543 RepID=UPI000B421975|nr:MULTISPECIES: hypothetical protein [Enterobacteriaceae]ELY4796631.1 hypothetical protein [Cronobacter sakazakii]HBQ6089905.1 hypothetical protein [Klebsiella pneumoniae subsp. pneumoniae]HBS2860662.1 hypothetical protein [Klebsiella variicola subsp. variicola]HCI6124156.1 hypothetical protein [Klebsiella quasipneumoniae subsp. similipneumoniae]ELA0371512.1 hypothetical protein [Klebsiella pneumoniae]